MDAYLKKMLPAILIMAAVLGLYGGALHHPFFFDDVNFFELGGLNNIFLGGFVFEPRWLPYFITAWLDLIFEDNIFAQRSVNVGLHLLTGFVLYALIKQVSDHVAPHRHNQRAALVACLLFLLHPLAVYTVGYLIQRTVLMATLFGLLSLNAYFDGLVTRRKAYFFFSALFYLLSVFSKEHAVLIPAVALALTPLAAPITRQTWRELMLPFSLFLVIAVLVLIKSRTPLMQVYEPFVAPLLVQHAANAANVANAGNEGHQSFWLLSVMTQASLFFKYLLLILVPNPGWMSLDMRVPLAAHVSEPKYLLGAFAFVAYATASLRWLFKGGRRGLVGLALLSPLLLFLVEFSAVRIQEPFVLYRTFLWMPLLFMLVPALTQWIPGKWFWPTSLFIALVLATASVDRLKSFAGGCALWDDTIRKLPTALAFGSARAYNYRGLQCYLERKDPLPAIADFTRALEVDPTYKFAYVNRALLYKKKGEYNAAIQDAKMAVQLEPKDAQAASVLAQVYLAAGQKEMAQAIHDDACKRGLRVGCLNQVKTVN